MRRGSGNAVRPAAGGGVAELDAVAEIDAEAGFRLVVRVSDPGSGKVKRRSGNAVRPGRRRCGDRRGSSVKRRSREARYGILAKTRFEETVGARNRENGVCGSGWGLGSGVRRCEAV